MHEPQNQGGGIQLLPSGIRLVNLPLKDFIREAYGLAVNDQIAGIPSTGKVDWNDEEYFESGRENVRRQILTDMENVCQGKDPKQMTVLEIGCGSGRITRALSEVFGQVYGVDISGEMIRLARQALHDRPNAYVFQNNGFDLSVLGDIQVDFPTDLQIHFCREASSARYTRSLIRLSP